MRILFIGGVEFSASALQELIAMKANIVGVCTVSNSVVNSDHFDLSPVAYQVGIPTKLTPNINRIRSLGSKMLSRYNILLWLVSK